MCDLNLKLALLFNKKFLVVFCLICGKRDLFFFQNKTFFVISQKISILFRKTTCDKNSFRIESNSEVVANLFLQY